MFSLPLLNRVPRCGTCRPVVCLDVVGCYRYPVIACACSRDLGAAWPPFSHRLFLPIIGGTSCFRFVPGFSGAHRSSRMAHDSFNLCCLGFPNIPTFPACVLIMSTAFLPAPCRRQSRFYRERGCKAFQPSYFPFLLNVFDSRPSAPLPLSAEEKGVFCSQLSVSFYFLVQHCFFTPPPP